MGFLLGKAVIKMPGNGNVYSAGFAAGIMKKFVLVFLVFCLFAGITGCSDSGSSETADSGKRKLYLFNWTYYTPDSVIQKFEEEFNVDVVYDSYPSNEEMFAKLRGGGSGYDLVIPSGDYVTIMNKLGMLEPIDLNKIPNAANISSFTLEKVAFDPEMEYSVPYYMGAAGIAVNKTKVSDYNRDWSIFEDERYKDRMVMLNDVREVLGDALIHLGYSANSKNPEELKAAEDLVVNKWKPNLVKFDAESFAKGFASGEYWIAHGYSEGFFQEIGSREKWNETVDFFIPQEGGAMYIDCFCILKGSKNVDLAHEFINFFHRPEIYAEFLDYFKFPATVNPAAAAYMKEEPVYTAEALANCQIKEDLAEALPMYSQTWERIRLY